MAHLLPPPPTTGATTLSTRLQKSSSLYSWKNGCSKITRVCCVGHQHRHQVSDQDQVPPLRDDHSLRRRALVGLSGAVVLGLGWGDEQSASGAGRPPPPPPREKKDPNVSGVQAKVLASKKRKEAMKEAMSKLREKGKAINKEPPSAPPVINKEPPPAPPAIDKEPPPASPAIDKEPPPAPEE
ncbi:hypothetical protein SESBI_44235 [Sesbania bispinosa]|nr:hypothetical protein SESBI_44235 [Sesbania bispinosa]